MKRDGRSTVIDYTPELCQIKLIQHVVVKIYMPYNFEAISINSSIEVAFYVGVTKRNALGFAKKSLPYF